MYKVLLKRPYNHCLPLDHQEEMSYLHPREIPPGFPDLAR